MNQRYIWLDISFSFSQKYLKYGVFLIALSEPFYQALMGDKLKTNSKK